MTLWKDYSTKIWLLIIKAICVRLLLSCLWLFVTLWSLACQAPLSVGFPGKNIGVGWHSFSRGSSQPRDWDGNRQEGEGSPNGGNRLQVSDIFPSLYKIKRRFLLKFSVAMMIPGSTWTFIKPWANQCVFLMEMFFLSYVNELCIYPRLCLSPSQFCLRFRTNKGSTNQYVLLIHCSPNLC